MNSFSIDSLFSKQFRLKTLKQWDAREFEEQLGNRTEWGIITGRTYSGKSTVATMLAQLNRGKILNMTQIAEECKKRLGTEDEPFEGEVPLSEVEKDTIAIVNKDKACSQQFTYIFDGYLHKTADAFVNWFSSEFGAPSFHLQLQADKDLIYERFRKRNEIEGDELSEDQLAELESQKKAAETEKKLIDQALKEYGGKTRVIELNTDASLESTLERLRSDFCAKVILINHENRLHVDTSCANLAIKFNMLYVSVFQLIKEHIEKQTLIGKALAKSYQ